MIIRRMEEADLEQVVEIEGQSFSQPWSKEGFLEGMKQENNLFLVMEQDNCIQGYVDMYCCMGEGEITNIAVRPEGRGNGVGASLMKACIEWARENSLDRIVLEVRVSNRPAIGLYEKYGFSSLGIRKDFYDFPKENAYIMSLENLSGQK